MRKSSNITLYLTDIIDGSIPTHEGRVGDFGVSLVDVVLDKIGGSEMFPNLKIDEWIMKRSGRGVEVQYSWEERPKIDIEILETVLLEIMEKVYDHRGYRVVHLESEIRDVFVNHFDPVEE